jgi:hypothetical protein
MLRDVLRRCRTGGIIRYLREGSLLWVYSLFLSFLLGDEMERRDADRGK